MFIAFYECITAAGFGVKSLLHALHEQRVCASQNVNSGGLVCKINRPNNNSTNNSVLDQFLSDFDFCWNSILTQLKNADPNFKDKKYGVILASTKGILEDFISESNKNTQEQWNEENIRAMKDPYNLLLEKAISKVIAPELSSSKNNNLNHNLNQIQIQNPIQYSIAISNACSSSHLAIELAKDKFNNSDLDYILILSADALGRFVYQGFDSLKVLSHTKNKPFDQSRDGLQLGEASSIIFLSRECLSSNSITVDAVCSKTVASSITRPSSGGEGLLKALNGLDGLIKPDFFIAHGTGTIFNDAAENEAYGKYLQPFANENDFKKPLVLNTKWSIGHTLGASGAIDIITACEVLKTQRPFNNPSLEILDSQFNHNLTQYTFDTTKEFHLQTGIVTSLGFGGVQAAIRLVKSQDSKSQCSIKKNQVTDKIQNSQLKLVNEFSFECNVIQRDEPPWKDRVERWSQFDEYTYALCSAFHHWVLQSLLPKKCNLILISYGGSNLADFEFVKTGMISPAKFVYTLPNVALAAICQIWGWSGKAYVLVKDAEDSKSRTHILSGMDSQVPTLVIDSPVKLNQEFRTVRAQWYEKNNEPLL